MKARIYARAGIPEYWIVNVKAGCVEVSRDPDPSAGSCGTKLTAGRDQVLESASVPGLSIPVASMFD